VLIVGVDPGTIDLGYGIVEVSGRVAPVFIACGVLHAPADWPRWRRLEHLGSQLDAVLAARGLEAGIDAAAVENAYVPRHRYNGALELAEARGTATYVCARRGLGVMLLAPSSVKLAVCGSGKADKQQVQRIVALRLRLPSAPAEDAADALGVALAAAPILTTEGIRATA
jgi:crossover junction endodeoxyribonuclease RuvC